MDESSAYVYTPLPKADEDIRILLLRCHGRSQHDEMKLLCGRDLRTSKPYVALSYTWDEDPILLKDTEEGLIANDPDLQLALTVGGKQLPIRTNLAKAIKRLRYQGCKDGCAIDCQACTRRFWIDSVCINQEDLHERNMQVSIMGNIYADAEMCVAWLGEDSALRDGEVTMGLIGHYQHCPDQSQFPVDCGSHSSHHWEANLSVEPAHLYEKFLNRHYFRRLWIVQEIILSKAAILCCGPTYLPWPALKKAMNHISVAAGLPGWAQFSSCFGLVLLSQSYEAKNLDVFELLDTLQTSACSDPRDRFGALSGVCPGIPTVDYTESVEHNYLLLAETLVDQGYGLHVVVSAAVRRSSEWRRNPDYERSLPSWVPDWRLHANVVLFLSHGLLAEPHVKVAAGSHALPRLQINLQSLGRIVGDTEGVGFDEIKTDHGVTLSVFPPPGRLAIGDLIAAVTMQDVIVLIAAGPSCHSDGPPCFRLAGALHTFASGFECQAHLMSDLLVDIV